MTTMTPQLKYLRAFEKMSDAELKKEWEKQSKLAEKHRNRIDWYIPKNKQKWCELELMGRGYVEKTVWVKL